MPTTPHDEEWHEAPASRTLPDTVLEDPFRGAFDHAVIGMALMDVRGRWITVNPSLCGIVGYTAKELLSTTFLALTHPDDVAADLDHLRQTLSGEIFSYELEKRCVHRRGHVVWVLASVSLVRDRTGRPLHFIVQVQDITDRRRAAEDLREANEKLKLQVGELEQRTNEMRLVGEMGELIQACRSVVEAYKIAARSLRQLFPDEAGTLCAMNADQRQLETVLWWGGDPTTEAVFATDQCCSLWWNSVHLVENPELDLICPHVAAAHPGAFSASYMCLPLMAQGETLGILHLCHAAGGPLPPAQKQLAHTVAEQLSLALANLRLQETLRSQSVRDPLTGLFNRRYLEESLERELNRAQRTGRPLSLVILDVDHFKSFNDTYGHETGDVVLREVAGVLHQQLRKADVACRFGGEEFVLILPDAVLEDAVQKAEQVRQAAKGLIVRHRGEPVRTISVSLGVAAFATHGSTGERLLQAADAALYAAKRGGRDRVVVAAEES